MIFRQSFFRDLNGIAGIMFATLFTIMVTTSLTRFLGRAATDRIASADVMPLIAYSTVGFIPILLVLTIFLSILMVLSRAWRDSEMVVWMASGLGLRAWIRPVLAFAVPYAIAVFIVSTFVAPWANQKIEEAKQRFEQREDVAALAPGQFRESRSSNRVFFVESVEPGARKVRNVFVAQVQDGKTTVVASHGGSVETQDGSRLLVLNDGRRYDGQWGEGSYTMMEFLRYGLRLEQRARNEVDVTVRTMFVTDLIRDGSDSAKGELLNRLSFPISAIVVALLAIPLSYVNPRVGRSVNIVAGVLIYFIYTNFNGLEKAWVSSGRFPFWVALWLNHAVVLLLTWYLFRRRSAVVRFSPRRLLNRLRGASAPDRAADAVR